LVGLLAHPVLLDLWSHRLHSLGATRILDRPTRAVQLITSHVNFGRAIRSWLAGGSTRSGVLRTCRRVA
jgi:hypothetical protein